MPKVSHECLKKVQEALEAYVMEVEGTGLSPLTKNTCLLHARNFVP